MMFGQITANNTLGLPGQGYKDSSKMFTPGGQEFYKVLVTMEGTKFSTI